MFTTPAEDQNTDKSEQNEEESDSAKQQSTAETVRIEEGAEAGLERGSQDSRSNPINAQARGRWMSNIYGALQTSVGKAGDILRHVSENEDVKTSLDILGLRAAEASDSGDVDEPVELKALVTVQDSTEIQNGAALGNLEGEKNSAGRVEKGKPINYSKAEPSQPKQSASPTNSLSAPTASPSSSTPSPTPAQSQVLRFLHCSFQDWLGDPMNMCYTCGSVSESDPTNSSSATTKGEGDIADGDGDGGEGEDEQLHLIVAKKHILLLPKSDLITEKVRGERYSLMHLLKITSPPSSPTIVRFHFRDNTTAGGVLVKSIRLMEDKSTVIRLVTARFEDLRRSVLARMRKAN